jgi:hypothetical protein
MGIKPSPRPKLKLRNSWSMKRRPVLALSAATLRARDSLAVTVSWPISTTNSSVTILILDSKNPAWFASLLASARTRAALITTVLPFRVGTRILVSFKSPLLNTSPTQHRERGQLLYESSQICENRKNTMPASHAVSQEPLSTHS